MIDVLERIAGSWWDMDSDVKTMLAVELLGYKYKKD